MKQSTLKKQFVLMVVFILLARPGFAQAKTDSFEIKKKWWGYASIKYEGKELTKMREYAAIMKPDPIASGYLYKAKQKQKIDLIIDNSGLVCLIIAGISHNYSQSKHSSFSDNSAYLGCGLIVLSVPFTLSANHNFSKAMRAYNSDVRMRGL